MALLVVVVLSYGLRAFSLGFFWDDWPYLWFYENFGGQGIVDAFSGDRPFLSFIYTLTLGIFGNSATKWQMFALAARWLCSLGLWWMLALTWPRSAHKAAWAVLLFTVYPGFTQHWISVIYGQAFFLFALVFFSMSLTLLLARASAPQRKVWLVPGTILALALSGFTMFSTEYFFGLELLRPVLLWLVFARVDNVDKIEGSLKQQGDWKRRLVKTAKWWLPYLLLMIAFVVWRGLIHTFPGKELTVVAGTLSSPLHTLTHLGLTVVEDIIEASLAAWGQTLDLGLVIENNPSAGLKFLAFMALTALLTGLYLAVLRPHASTKDQPTDERHDHWAREALLVGLFAVLVAGWPFWITGLPMRMGFPQDRYSLPLAVGICLMIAGLVDALGKDLPRKAVILSVIIALAAGFHFNLALAYREDWNRAKDFFWQLTWRAPGVQPDTLFLTYHLPFTYFEDDSLTAPLNWTYDPEMESTQMGYLLYDLEVRQHSMPELNPGQPVEVARDVRTTTFKGSTSQVLVVDFAQPGCVKVLDPVYHADLYRLPDKIQQALPVSAPAEQIFAASSPATPPEEIFGSEPKHRWCYFYEKAELARQLDNWEEITRLTDESIGSGYFPEDPAEYLPFVEGHTQMMLWDDALQLTRRAYQASPALRPALCAIWQRSLQDGQPHNEDHAKVLGWADQALDCPAIP